MTRWNIYEKDGRYRAGKPRLSSLLGIKWLCHWRLGSRYPTNFLTIEEVSKEVAELNYVLDHPEEFKHKEDYWKVVR